MNKRFSKGLCDKISKKSMEFDACTFWRVKTLRRPQNDFLLFHLQRGTSDLPRGLKACLEGFVSSRNSLVINFDRKKDLVLFLRQFTRKTVDNLVESIEQTSPIVCSCKIYCKHVLQSLSNNNIQSSILV